jgi:hypothetical protein
MEFGGCIKNGDFLNDMKKLILTLLPDLFSSVFFTIIFYLKKYACTPQKKDIKGTIILGFYIKDLS